LYNALGEYIPFFKSLSLLTPSHLFYNVTRTLAAIFQSEFVTPELLTIAAEKVFSHRLQLKSTRIQRIQQGREHGGDSTPSHLRQHPSSASLRSSGDFSQSSQQSSSEEQGDQGTKKAVDVVQDVLKVVFPPI